MGFPQLQCGVGRGKGGGLDVNKVMHVKALFKPESILHESGVGVRQTWCTFFFLNSSIGIYFIYHKVHWFEVYIVQ